MFFGLGQGDEQLVEITSRSRVVPSAALQWLAGDEPLMTTEQYAIRGDEYRETSVPIAMYRRQKDLFTTAARAETALRIALKNDYPEDRVQEARAEYLDLLGDLAGHINSMVRNGIPPTRFAPSMVEDMKELGILDEAVDPAALVMDEVK